MREHMKNIVIRIANLYLSLFDDKFHLAIFSFVVASTAFVAIFVRGFQVDTWAWTEFYADSYYYLAYAKQASAGEFFNYSGVGPSSGIHPLHWLFLTICMVVSGGNEDVFFPLLFVTFAIAFFVTVSAVVFTLKTVGVRPEMRFLAVIAMAYGNYLVDVLEVPLAIPVIFTNFTNMMESWLLITSISLMLAFGVRHLITYQKSRALVDLVIVVGAAVIAVWCRVDYILIILPFVAVVVWRSKTLIRIQSIALILVPLTAAVIWHLVLWGVTGNPISTSGSVKSILPIALQLDLRSAAEFLLDNSAQSLSKLHILIALVGILVSTALLFFVPRKKIIQHNLTLVTLSSLQIGMITMLAYHVLFTFQNDIGGWYFRPYRIPLLIIALFGISSIVVRHKTFFARNFSNRVVETGAACLTILVLISHLFAPSAADNSTARAHAVRDVVDELNVIVDDSSKFLDGTDGAFGWFSNYTAYHMKGMANTPEYADTGRLVRVKNMAELSETLEIYMRNNEIDFVVSYGSGDAKRYNNLCWSNLQKIAYSENRTGDKIAFAFATTRSSWLDYMSCHPTQEEDSLTSPSVSNPSKM